MKINTIANMLHEEKLVKEEEKYRKKRQLDSFLQKAPKILVHHCHNKMIVKILK